MLARILTQHFNQKRKMQMIVSLLRVSLEGKKATRISVKTEIDYVKDAI